MEATKKLNKFNPNIIKFGMYLIISISAIATFQHFFNLTLTIASILESCLLALFMVLFSKYLDTKQFTSTKKSIYLFISSFLIITVLSIILFLGMYYTSIGNTVNVRYY